MLLIAQTRLIAHGRRDIHKLLGMAGVAIGVAVVFTGIFVAINSERRVHTAATADTLADPYVFLTFPFASVGLFALFATLGVIKRNRPDAHKRLMLLATASMIVPALARIVTQTTQGGRARSNRRRSTAQSIPGRPWSFMTSVRADGYIRSRCGVAQRSWSPRF